MVYPVLTLLPAPEYFFPVQLPIEVDEPRLEPLEHAADLLELEQEIVDLTRDVLDTAAQRELLGRFAPLGPGLRGDELVLRDQIAPVRMEGDEVGDDTLHEGERTIGFGQSEILSGHRVKSTRCEVESKTHRRIDA